jgi:predicted dehydrogenase
LINELRVGVVGCGYWGSKHARVMSSLSDVAQVALIDSRQERLAGVAESIRGAQTFSCLSDALPEVDAVVIATPPSSHVPLALECIRAGKHVLVEKPLALDSRGAQLLVDEAADAGVALMVGHTFEYNSAVWKLRELIDSGDLGDLYYIDTARLNLGLYQSDVNVIMDLAPHDISIINFLLRRKPTAVEAWGSAHANRQREDVAYLRLYYDDINLTANVHVSWLDPCKVRRVTAVGSRKMAVYNDLATEERIRVHDKGVLHPTPELVSTGAPMSYRYGDITSPFLTFDEPLAVQDRHFALCATTGLRPESDGLVGLAVVQALECAQLSLAEGRRVQLAEVEGHPVYEPVATAERRIDLTAALPQQHVPAARPA